MSAALAQEPEQHDPGEDEPRHQWSSLYFKSFARVCLLPYVGGTVIHVLRLIYRFPVTELPAEVDWVVVIVGGYAGLGLIVFARRIPFTGVCDKIAYGLLIFHLDGSVLLHAYILLTWNHRVLGIFPYGYSFVAAAYFLALGLYVANLNKRLYWR